MFTATKKWLHRNQTPLAIGVGVVGAGYAATQYLWGRVNDARERMSSERIAKENLRRRFEQNQEDCTYTVAALLPTAANHILEAMDTETITVDIQNAKRRESPSSTASMSISGDSVEVLRSIEATEKQESQANSSARLSLPRDDGNQSGRDRTSSPMATFRADHGPARTKRQLWRDLTISAITRSYTLIYTLGLLIMLTRIQLNLLGRRSYLSSVVALATDTAQATISLENNDDDNAAQVYGNDFDVNRRYLTFSWWLLNRGWVEIMHRVEFAVTEVFGSLSPREQLSLATFQEMSYKARKLVEADGKWLAIVLPPQDMEEYVLQNSGILDDGATSSGRDVTTIPHHLRSTLSLRRLLDETADLVESHTFAKVLGQSLDAGFRVLLTGVLTQAVSAMPNAEVAMADTTTSVRACGSTTEKVPLPKILSVLTRQAHVIGNGMPNEYQMEMERVADLDAFSAIVYSSNWDTEIAEPGESDKAAAPSEVPAQEVLAESSQPMSNEGPGESVVIVDPTQSSFESAWNRASDKS